MDPMDPMDPMKCCQQKQSPESCHHVASIDDKETPLFFCLPLCVRYLIYEFSLLNSRKPSAHYVHEKLLSNVWKDKPSPLLTINKQIRAEMFDLLRHSPFTMRITWQDKRFDALALSSFIVQQRQNYHDIPHLTVEIWPPHPDRPIDAYWIYEHLRLLREDLRTIPRIPKLDLVFLENDIATWSNHDDKLSKWLEIDDPTPPEDPMFTDIGHMLDLFDRLTNVSKARICLPDSFTDDKRYQDLRDYAQTTEEIMMGTFVLPEVELTKDDVILENYRLRNNLPEDHINDAESHLKLITARIARKKLKTITNSCKMNELEFYTFVEIWPHFETLDEFEGDGEFSEHDYVTPIDYFWQ